MKARFLNIFLLIWLLIFPVSRCAAFEFTVQGEVHMQGYKQGQLEGETNYNFTAEIRDCSSRIRVSGGRFASTEFNEFGWDTTNSYMFIKLRDDRATKAVRYLEDGKFITKQFDRPFKSANDGTLAISLDALPEYGRGMEPVWLAYASGCYYGAKKSGSNTLPIWWMGAEVREANLRFLSEWQLNQSTPHLLDSFADFTDGNKYETTGSKPVPVKMSKPFDVPMTNSIYRVLSWTNVSGLALPQRFQVIRYERNMNGASTPLLHVLEVYEGVAHSILPTCAVSDFGPKVPGAVPVQVTDERLMNDLTPARGIGYFSPTGKVANLEELKKSDPYQQALQQALRTTAAKPDSGNMRRGLIVLMIITLSFPLWLLAKGKWRIKKKQNADIVRK